MLVYGEQDTRRRAALGLVGQRGDPSVASLASTVFSQDPLLLRARSLEALGVAAAGTDEETAQEILDSLLSAALVAPADRDRR
jgi:hypothetical protein